MSRATHWHPDRNDTVRTKKSSLVFDLENVGWHAADDADAALVELTALVWAWVPGDLREGESVATGS